jgi:hypothetical protein
MPIFHIYLIQDAIRQNKEINYDSQIPVQCFLFWAYYKMQIIHTTEADRQSRFQFITFIFMNEFGALIAQRIPRILKRYSYCKCVMCTHKHRVMQQIGFRVPAASFSEVPPTFRHTLQMSSSLWQLISVY